MQRSTKTELALAICHLTFLSSSEKKIIFEKLESLTHLKSLSVEEMSKLVNRNLRTKDGLNKDFDKLVENCFKLMAAYKIEACFIEDSAYPPLLKEIFDPPFMIFWHGNIECLHKKCCGMVGTRRATAAGLKNAFNTASILAQNGVTVVSGLAMGIDTASHKGALDARQSLIKANLQNGANSELNENENVTENIGKTAAVLACGVENIYPATNRKLAGQIIQTGGCILSEYPPGQPAFTWTFPARNRIIAALCQTTLVVQAPAGSGALITADFALEQGRDLVFCSEALKYPAGKTDEKNAGKRSVQNYIEEGAPLIQAPEEILNFV